MTPSSLFSNTMKPVAVNAFESETAGVLTELQNVLNSALGMLQPPVTRAAELQRRLKLDAKLSWSVFSAANAPTPHSLTSLLPGTRAMNRFFEALEREGVADELLLHARETFAKFEQVVRTHAADRDTFDAMVSALSPSNDNLIDDRLRKRLFTDHSILWGVRSKCSFLCYICRPTEGDATPVAEDAAIITGCFQLEQLREGQPLSLETSAIADTAFSAGKLLSQLNESTPPGERSPLVLLREFCAGPVPEVHQDQGGIAGERTIFKFGGLGRASAVDLVMVQTVKGMPSRPDAPLSAFAVPTSPSEVSCCDFLLPVGAADPHSVRARVFGNRLNMSRVFDRRPEDLLPMRVSAVYRGRIRFQPNGQLLPTNQMRSPLAMPESARYPEMVAQVVGNMNWADVEYDVFRCHVRYPVLHGLIEILVDRGEKDRRIEIDRSASEKA